MGINAHRAFEDNATTDNYITQLTVIDEERDALRRTRDQIRGSLKTGLQNWSGVVKKRELFEGAALDRRIVDEATPLRPKFKMQGSWSYHTLNCTTQEPPQEIDLDDGMFLPVSYLSQNGSTHPAIISSAYFSAVEGILFPLCNREGWTLVTDMPSCVRVEIRKGAHVDIALYAIPDDEFRVLIEKADATVLNHMALDQDMHFAENVYPELPADHIMLAHREQGWKPSDPRKLEEWFQGAVDRHGAQLRRVCRYLKGWRDSRWDKCRLSSIALMACVVSAYDDCPEVPDARRDDQALAMVSHRLPTLLSQRIRNPVVDGQFLDEKWDGCRQEFVDSAIQLSAVMKSALAAHTSEAARDYLVAEFGKYMPTNAVYYVVDSLFPTILDQGILSGLGTSEVQRAAVKLGGDDRYG